MTSSLPSSVDLLYGFSQSSDLLTNTSSITPNTLWAKLNECDECIFFRNMAAKSLIAKDFNDANIMYHTIFVPISFIGGEEMVPNEYISSLTIPGQFFILPNEIPTNIKVQNKLKEYLSVNIESKGRGGGAYVQAVDRLWKVTSANVPCSNGMIHFLQEVYV